MRLQLGGNEHGVHGAGGQSEFGGQSAYGPAALIVRLLAHARLHLVPGLEIILGGSTRPRGVSQALDAVDGEGPPPLPDRDRWNLQRSSDLLIRRSIGRRQDDATAQGK